MNRHSRARLAQETLQIIERGSYRVASGKIVTIGTQIQKAIECTELYAPEELEKLLAEWQEYTLLERRETRIEVTNETTLSAAHRLVVEEGHDRTLCLNFASAKHPGGGFLSGSQAQEESLARSSALYACLTTQPVYYEMNRRCGTALYTDHMILSPEVPVFRDDDGMLLDAPYRVGFLTAPATNAGAVLANEPGNVPKIVPVLSDRSAKLLAVAASRGYSHLVLGAWGCGVFRNKPMDVARIFAELLTGNGCFGKAFESVTFAIWDRPPSGDIIRPFEACLRPG